jgi:hypothetical protein
MGDSGRSDLSVTAFVGGEKYGSSIQFTTKNDYVALSEKQVLDLIAVLANRLRCKKGWSATDYGNEKTMLPNGKIKKCG